MLYHTKEKLAPSDMYVCVFIDYDSGFMRINHQVAINDTESVKDKTTFQRGDQSQGMAIKVYHPDN